MACIQEIAQIKNKNTDSEDKATLEGLEKIIDLLQKSFS